MEKGSNSANRPKEEEIDEYLQGLTGERQTICVKKEGGKRFDRIEESLDV